MNPFDGPWLLTRTAASGARVVLWPANERMMFLWASFRYDFDTTAWLQKTLEKGVVYVPGEFFFSDHADKRTLRFSYATATDDRLAEAVKRLKAAL